MSLQLHQSTSDESQSPQPPHHARLRTRSRPTHVSSCLSPNPGRKRSSNRRVGGSRTIKRGALPPSSAIATTSGAVQNSPSDECLGGTTNTSTDDIALSLLLESSSLTPSLTRPKAITYLQPVDAECSKLLSLTMQRETCRFLDPSKVLDDSELPDAFEEVVKTPYTLHAARKVQEGFNREVERHLQAHYWSKGSYEPTDLAPSIEGDILVGRACRESFFREGLTTADVKASVDIYRNTVGSVDTFIARMQEALPWLGRLQIIHLRMALEEDFESEACRLNCSCVSP
ncbi:hypothetical protein PM082_011205 [Marasmius tenuissimus]|nr:hypothetical protein PM082_011205 [Marasmius tenuissimus]